MMNLKMQIVLIIYSLLFGVLFSFLLRINYKIIKNKSKGIKNIIIFLFTLNAVFIYFLVLKKINSGILHVYSFLLIFTGFILEHLTVNYLAEKINK